MMVDYNMDDYLSDELCSWKIGIQNYTSSIYWTDITSVFDGKAYKGASPGPIVLSKCHVSILSHSFTSPQNNIKCSTMLLGIPVQIPYKRNELERHELE